MDTRDSIIIFRNLESDSYFQALVALDYYFDYPHRKVFGGFSATSQLRDNIKSKVISEIYKEAIIRKFIPQHMQNSEKDAFLKKPREYKILVNQESKPGILGLGKSPCWFYVVLSEFCIHCNGKLRRHYKTFSSDSHIEVFVCSKCQQAPKVQPPYFPIGHEFGLPITEGCQVVKKCKGCGHSSVVSKHHKYSEWKYDSSHICRQIRVCSECQVMEGREFHTEKIISRTLLESGWNESLDVSRNKYRKYVQCTTCGKQWEYEITENET
jgi:hypothetical protein